MGSAYFIATEREIAGYAADSVEGKMLAKADMQLDEAGFYEQRGLKALHHYCGDDVSYLFEGLDIDPVETGETWFDANEGLAVVEGLLGYLQTTPGTVIHQDLVVGDLLIFQAVLNACKAENVRWYLSIDI